MDIVPLLGIRGVHHGRHIHLEDTGRLVEKEDQLSTLACLARVIDTIRKSRGEIVVSHKPFSYFGLFENLWVKADLFKVNEDLDYKRMDVINYLIDTTDNEINRVRNFKHIFLAVKKQLKNVKEIIVLLLDNFAKLQAGDLNEIKLTFNFISHLIYKIQSFVKRYANSIMPENADACELFHLTCDLIIHATNLYRSLSDSLVDVDGESLRISSENPINRKEEQPEKLIEVNEYDKNIIEFSTLMKNKKFKEAIDFFNSKLVSEKRTGDYNNNLLMLVLCHIECQNFGDAIALLSVCFSIILLVFFLFFSDKKKYRKLQNIRIQ